MAFLNNFLFRCFRFLAVAFHFVESKIETLVQWWDMQFERHSRRFFVRTDGSQFDEHLSHVPGNSLYFEHVAPNKVRVLYEDDEITPYEGDPDEAVQVPWLWIGHVPSDTDLTPALRKYLIPGNFILLDLLIHLLGREDEEGFMYLDARTTQLRKFPVEGIRINRLDDTLSGS